MELNAKLPSTTRIEYLGFLFDLTRDGVTFVSEVDPLSSQAKAIFGELDIYEQIRSTAQQSIEFALESQSNYFPWELIVQGVTEGLNAKVVAVDDNEGPYPDGVVF